MGAGGARAARLRHLAADVWGGLNDGGLVADEDEDDDDDEVEDEDEFTLDDRCWFCW